MERISSIRLLEDLEYFMQLSFFTADLHVSRAWSVESDDVEQKVYPSSSMEKKLGPYSRENTFSVLELSALDPPVAVDTILERKKLPPYLDSTVSTVFPLGLLDSPKAFCLKPTGIFHFLLFKLHLGRSYCTENMTLEEFRATSIPNGYNSLLYAQSDARKDIFKYSARIVSPQQVVPWALIEVEFKPLRVDVTPPICDYCEAYDATVYCLADEVHLCDTCDYNHHSGNKLFMRHRRVPVSESPNLFGVCQLHPSELTNTCCLTCYVPLCSQCLLIGDHGDPENKDHAIVSTTDAYRLAVSSLTGAKNEPISTADRKELILQQQTKDFVTQLESMFVHADSLKSRVDAVAQKLAYHIQAIRQRKMDVCNAVERQWTTIILQMEWAEAFMSHLRSALPPSHALLFRRRHDALVTCLFYGSTAASSLPHALPKDNLSRENNPFQLCLVDPQLPQWVLQRLHLVGDLTINPIRLQLPHHFSSRNRSIGSSSGLFFQGDSSEAVARKENVIPPAQWIPFASEDLGTSGRTPLAQRQDAYLVGNLDHNMRLVTELVDAPAHTQYLGPLVYAQSKVEDEQHLEKPLLHEEASEGSSVTAFPMHNDATTAVDPLLPKMLSHQGSPKTAVTRAALQPKYGGFPVTGLQEKEDYHGTGVRFDDEHFTVAEEIVSPLWNPKLKPRVPLYERVWTLLKEYRYEALITLLKTAPKEQRKNLMRNICNAANYMWDLENVIWVLIEVESHWVSRLPSYMLARYPSLIVPLLQHIFGSTEVLTIKDARFLQDLVLVPWHQIMDYIEKEIAVSSDATSLTMETIYQRHKFMFYGIINRFFKEHMIKITAESLPPTLRSLLYSLADYGSGLPVIRYPDGVLYDPFFDEPWGRARVAVGGQENDFGKLDGKAYLRIREASKEKTLPNPSVALCVEAFLRYGLSGIMYDRAFCSRTYCKKESFTDKQNRNLLNKIQLCSKWILINLFRQVAIAVWHLFEKGQDVLEPNEDAKALAEAAYKWMKDIVLQRQRYASSFTFNLTKMPDLGHQAFLKLSSYILNVDNSLRRDTTDIFSDMKWDARNVEPLVAAALACCQ